ncbi:hypothetical protein KY290_001870 [Solanum tuberosum]|uniref:F-box domain-containing protein n=1 Tax=Solanum tuberosum TaxID=4113 RepID=A0ABQ7WNF7_SOLTU|nr:hypothetical protein KY290_001870 [Solanum tuberosum]
MENEREEMESTNGKSKRVCVRVENDAVCATGGRWDELSPELLASIFVRIVPPELMVKSVALVCRNWMEIVSGPYCWTEIDLEHWCRKCCIANRSHLIDPVVRKIVRRSRSTFRRLSTYRLGDVGFSFAASRVARMVSSSGSSHLVLQRGKSKKEKNFALFSSNLLYLRSNGGARIFKERFKI